MTEDKKREYARAYYRQYRDKINALRKASRSNMTDEQRAKMSEYQKRYQKTHKDALNAYQREWRRKNPEKYAARKLREKVKNTPHYLRKYWVSVAALKPKLIPQEPNDGIAWSKSADVMVLIDDGTIETGHYEHDDFGPTDAWVLKDESLLTEGVTHWMPLPSTEGLNET